MANTADNKVIGEWKIPRRQSKLGILADNAVLILVVTFYLFCNLYIFFLPWAAYQAWRGALLPRALALLTCVDYCYPLRPGPKGLWIAWCKWTDYNGGLRLTSSKWAMPTCIYHSQIAWHASN
jgi:hypothetical protein